MIDAFAESTGDDQFIHVDPERAAQTPLGSTIAHGLLTLSLALGSPTGSSRSRASPSASTRLQPRPLPCPAAGERSRPDAPRPDQVEEIPGGAQMTITQTFESDGGDKPVCVAEQLARVYGGA